MLPSRSSGHLMGQSTPGQVTGSREERGHHVPPWTHHYPKHTTHHLKRAASSTEEPLCHIEACVPPTCRHLWQVERSRWKEIHPMNITPSTVLAPPPCPAVILRPYQEASWPPTSTRWCWWIEMPGGGAFRSTRVANKQPFSSASAWTGGRRSPAAKPPLSSTVSSPHWTQSENDAWSGHRNRQHSGTRAGGACHEHQLPHLHIWACSKERTRRTVS
jgi:hypothetical protein